MQPWWWRSVAACGSVVIVAGLVTAVAVATDGDRVQRDRSELVASAPPATPAAPTASPVAEATRPDTRGDTRGAPVAAPPRALDRATGADVAVPPGWRRVADQRVVPVPPGRFGTVLAAGDRAVVLVGALDSARVRTPASLPALEAEAGRLVAAFGDGAAPTARRLVPVRDDGAGVAGRAAWTAVRRVDGADRRTNGALVRVSTVDAAPGARTGVVLLAVVLPGATQVADARAAEDVVRSLEPVRPRAPGPVRPASGPRPAPSTGR